MDIYADPITVNCRKVLAGLKFLNVDYTLKHTDYMQRQFESPAYLALNPNATLPAMVDDGFTLWESNAILQYAAEKNGRKKEYPSDLKTRADINRWLLWESNSWFPSAYTYLVENCVKPVLGGQPDQAVLDGEEPRFRKLAGILEERLSKSPWLCGDGPTIADIAVAAPIHLNAGQKLPLKDFPKLASWMATKVEKLPAWEATYVSPTFSLERG